MTKSRRELFREAKEAAGGIENLIKSTKDRPTTVYFDDEGNIVAITRDPDFVPKETWKTYNFKQDQIEILNNDNHTNFMVKQDPKEQGIYYIEAKGSSVSYTTTAGFLTELSDTTDITYILSIDKLLLSFLPEVKNNYTKKDAATALYNGKKYIKVYLTAKYDPHTLFHSSVFSVESLILNDAVERQLNNDFTNCSVYAVL